MRPGCIVLVFGCGAALFAQPVSISVRTSVQPWKNASPKQVDLGIEIDPARSALVICDMWDKHWCSSAGVRVAKLAPKVGRLAKAMSDAGVVVIHAPSETMDFYKDAPQRKATFAVPPVPLPKMLDLPDPPLPVDASGGGCDTAGESFFKAWTRQSPDIPIGPRDFIADEAGQIYSILRSRDVQYVFFAGVHTNMCVLTRYFAIKNMVRWGQSPILVRDLTDALYNPADPPHVTQARGTELVVEYIERNWCPTVLSAELLRVLQRK